MITVYLSNKTSISLYSR